LALIAGKEWEVAGIKKEKNRATESKAEEEEDRATTTQKTQTVSLTQPRNLI